MKTVLHSIDTTGPGGAETLFVDLATRMPGKEYRSIVVINGKGWVYEELCRRGANPVLLNAKGSFNWRYLRSLCRLIRRERVDLIHSHLLGANVYCSLAGIITGTPVVATFHGSVDIGESERFVNAKLVAINKGAGHVIAVTESLRDDLLVRTRLRPDKVQVIMNGIDTAAFQKTRSDRLRQEFGWGHNDIIIGSLGNIRPAKGYDILLKAASMVGPGDRPYRFVIAGQSNSSLMDELLELRHELQVEDRVQFLGFTDDPAEFLSNLDIFLSSSVSEGLPLSAIQAMVAELPVVATRCGGYVGLITDMENGILVPPGDPRAIADAIERLGENSGLQESLSRNARRYAVDQFDIGVMLDAYGRVYEDLLAG